MDREALRPLAPGPHPILQMIAGAIVAAALIALVKCASAGSLPAVVECKLSALKVLPSDPLNATVYDAVDVIQRIRACGHAHPDGGP
jgi:hypothetical protein